MDRPYVGLGKNNWSKNGIYIWLLIALFAQTPYRIKTLIGLLQLTLNMPIVVHFDTSTIKLWYIEVLKHQRCFFVVINESKSALIISSRLDPTRMSTAGYKWVALGGIHNWFFVLSFCRSTCDFAFPDKILQGVRGEKLQLKTFVFFPNKLSFDQEISLCFSWLISSFQRVTAW